MESLADTLKETKAENKRLQVELEKGSEAKAEIERLNAELKKEQDHSAALTEYYNLTEPKMEALRQEACKVKAAAEKDAQRLTREMAKATESARFASLLLTWGRSDCCARLSAAVTMGLLQQNWSEHVAEFPKFVKGDWEVSSLDIFPALRAWCKQFWQKEGRSAAKARLLEHLAKAKAAEQREEPAAEEGGADAGAGADVGQDHPEGFRRKNKNEKFVAIKGLLKIKYSCREIIINGNSYKVLKVVGWMRAHPGRTLDDYDRAYAERREDMARFWRNHRRTDRQEAIAQRRYGLVCVSPPSPLRIMYNISSDDEPSSPNHTLRSGGCFGGEDVIFL
uniref:Uncharacterized protein n=1 Tax=Oryza barthii TaxID=65489 RepID=A0A0D3H4S6_9ORYZ